MRIGRSARARIAVFTLSATLAGAIAGLLGGTVLGFLVALLAMLLFDSETTDQSGLYGMIEVITWTPLGSLIGLLVGAFWGFRSLRPRRHPPLGQ